MKENLFETLHAADDADCLIVGTTLKLAKQTATNALVGLNTDLLVLLLFHVQSEHYKILFSTSTKSTTKVWEATTLQVAFSLLEKACQCRR